MYGVAGDKATDLDQIGRFLFNFGNPILMAMLGGVMLSQGADMIARKMNSCARKRLLLAHALARASTIKIRWRHELAGGHPFISWTLPYM